MNRILLCRTTVVREGLNAPPSSYYERRMEEGRGAEMSQPAQDLTLTNRERLEATGVQKVVSFDEREIALETVIGSLILEGEGLHITHLDLTAGELVVEGLIVSIKYAEDRGKKIKMKGKNILERLLK